MNSGDVFPMYEGFRGSYGFLKSKNCIIMKPTEGGSGGSVSGASISSVSSMRQGDYTHVAMKSQGRCFKITDEVVDEWQEWLVKDLEQYGPDSEQALRHYLVERGGPVIKFVLEVDLVAKTPCSREDILNLGKKFQEVMKQMIPGMSERELYCVVTSCKNWATVSETKIPEGSVPPGMVNLRKAFKRTSSEMEEEDNENGEGGGKKVFFVKNGAHFVWPNVVVHKFTAKRIRDVMVEECKKTFGRKIFEKSVEDTLDEHIYKPTGGLRMPFCLKGNAKVCDICEKGKAPTMIYGVCKHGYGGRAYELFSVLDGNGNEMPTEIDRLTKSKLQLLREGTIRVKSDAKVVAVPGLDSVEETITANVVEADNILALAAMQNEIHDGGDALVEGKKVRVDLASELGKGIIFICTTKYKRDPQVKGITKHFPGTERQYYTVESNSRFCTNKNGDHSGNRIYFLIKPSGVEIRCHCKKDEIRISGKSCKEYNTKPDKFSLDDCQKINLFPLLKSKNASYKVNISCTFQNLRQSLHPSLRHKSIQEVIANNIADEEMRLKAVEQIAMGKPPPKSNKKQCVNNHNNA